MNGAREEVTDVLQRYFGGLHHSDAEALGEVFHPRAHYVCPTDEPLRYLTMAEYLPIVQARPSPASLGQPREDEIDALTFGSPAMAFAQVRCAVAPKRFVDFLTLVKEAGRWQIISKVFHYDLEEADPCPT